VHTPTYWKQACLSSLDSDVYIPVVPVSGVRYFSSAQDTKVVEFVHAMRRRWGRTDWPIVAHALSMSEYVLRARWYCFIRPQEFRYYKQVQHSHSSRSDAPYRTEDSTVATIHSSVCNATDPGIRALVFDMVNTISITAALDATTLRIIRRNMRTAWADGRKAQRTIALNNMVALSDAHIAVIITSVTAWNAGTSRATSLTDLWEKIASKLDHKWPDKSLFAWWIKLCAANLNSQLIVCPVVEPITAAYLVSTFSQLFPGHYESHYDAHYDSHYDSTNQLLLFLQKTPLAKERWCQLLSHRPSKVYFTLQAQKNEENGSLSRNQLVTQCVKDMVSALELTERMDGYLASQSVAFQRTQQKRERTKTRSAVNVVLRGMVCKVVKKALPQSSTVLKLCRKCELFVSSWLHASSQLPTLPTVTRRPKLSIARRVLLLCVRYAKRTATKVNWPVLASLLRITEGALCVLWAEVQHIVCTLREGRWYMLKSLDEQLNLL